MEQITAKTCASISPPLGSRYGGRSPVIWLQGAVDAARGKRRGGDGSRHVTFSVAGPSYRIRNEESSMKHGARPPSQRENVYGNIMSDPTSWCRTAAASRAEQTQTQPTLPGSRRRAVRQGKTNKVCPPRRGEAAYRLCPPSSAPSLAGRSSLIWRLTPPAC